LFGTKKSNTYLPGPSKNKVKLSPSWTALAFGRPPIDNFMAYFISIFCVGMIALQNKYFRKT
jgi:hypothetical protein